MKEQLVTVYTVNERPILVVAEGMNSSNPYLCFIVRERGKISLKGSHNAQLSFEIMICYHRTGIVHKLISALKI